MLAAEYKLNNLPRPVEYWANLFSFPLLELRRCRHMVGDLLEWKLWIGDDCVVPHPQKAIVTLEDQTDTTQRLNRSSQVFIPAPQINKLLSLQNHTQESSTSSTFYRMSVRWLISQAERNAVLDIE